MARILLPAAVATTGVLLAAGMVLTTYTAPIEGASSDPQLYNLIARALHDPPLTPGPHPGQSSLSISQVPASHDSTTEGWPDEARADSGRAAVAPAVWAATAAKVAPEALRDWLGHWVVATSVVTGDTLHMTLRRFSLRKGCPWVSRLVATTAGVRQGEYDLVDVTTTCPDLRQQATVEAQ